MTSKVVGATIEKMLFRFLKITQRHHYFQTRIFLINQITEITAFE